MGPASSSPVASCQHLLSRCPWTLLEDSVSRGNVEGWVSHWHFGASAELSSEGCTGDAAPQSPGVRITAPFELQRDMKAPSRQTQPRIPTSPSCCWAQYRQSIKAAQSQDHLLCSCFLSPNPLFLETFSSSIPSLYLRELQVRGNRPPLSLSRSHLGFPTGLNCWYPPLR